MNRFQKLALAVSFVACFTVPAVAGTYRDAMKTCGTEWRASEARKSVTKGEGAKAWNAFRAECVKRVGYEKKARNKG